LSSESISVLLVEDEPSHAQIVRALVKSGGELFVCDWVETLALALERLAAGGIDVVLLDFGLPDSNGLESFSRLYGSAPNVAIIPLTGTGDDAMALEAVRLGAQDYLFKGSINQAILTRSIRYAVERKRISEALRQARDDLEVRVAERTAELKELYEAERSARERAETFAVENARLLAAAQASEEQLRSLSHRLVQVQESERRALARELHDEVGQVLTGLKLLIGTAARLPSERVGAGLEQAQILLNELMGRIRNLSLDLRPIVLDDLGLLHALLWHFDRYRQQTGIVAHFTQTGIEGRRFAPEIETAAYRIIQEALTNVARHAQVTEVNVHVWASNEMLTVQVEDRGRGFDAEAVLTARASGGLAGMEERAELLGGVLTIDAAFEIGTSLTANLPFDDQKKGGKDADNSSGR
jgi:signal transduction histidine kinase